MNRRVSHLSHVAPQCLSKKSTGFSLFVIDILIGVVFGGQDGTLFEHHGHTDIRAETRASAVLLFSAAHKVMVKWTGQVNKLRSELQGASTMP